MQTHQIRSGCARLPIVGVVPVVRLWAVVAGRNQTAPVGNPRPGTAHAQPHRLDSLFVLEAAKVLA